MRIFALLSWFICSMAVADADDVRMTFAAMGDVPYRSEERLRLAADLLDLPSQTAFVIHLGDIKPGTPFCGEGEYAVMARILKGSTVPVFIIPGDNEWNDCARPTRAFGYWLAHFRAFEQRWPGFEDVIRQESQPANFAFVRERIVFVGLHVVGGRVHDRAEWDTRHADDLTWLRTHLLPAGSADINAAVIFGHGQPSKATQDFFDGFAEVAEEFERPILYVHGDGHRWVHDQRFRTKNLQRVQIDRGGKSPPVLISVTGQPRSPFQFDRRKTR
jgi:hypothetical protein